MADNAGIVGQYSYAAAQTDAVIWDTASDKRFVITDLVISTTGANVITIEEDMSPDRVLFKFDLAANGHVELNLNTPIKGAIEGSDLILTSSGSTNLYVTVLGYEES